MFTLTAVPVTVITYTGIPALGHSSVLAEDVSIQEIVAELASGIQLFAQLHKIRQPLITLLELLAGDGEQFSPVWPDLEWSQFFFDNR